jgi:hypothetical protein
MSKSRENGRHALSTNRLRKAALVLLLGFVAALVAWTIPALAEDGGLPKATQRHVNPLAGTAPAAPGATISESDYKNPPNPVCSTPKTLAANVNTDCEGNAPHNETSIAVNPNDANNIIGSANDYQLFVSQGGHVNWAVYSRVHVTFDGGKSWTTYPIGFHGYTTTGDPAVAFDADGRAYVSTMGWGWSQGLSNTPGTNADILVSHSSNGGKTWSTPSRIAKGVGSSASVGVFNDKEYIAAWGHGNAIVTWSGYNQGQGGAYINFPIYTSVTHDGGKSWSTPREISGSASFCNGPTGGHACDQDEFSVPVVGKDGKIYVAFTNLRDFDEASPGYLRDRYLVVRVDPQTGRRVAGPYRVAPMIDGYKDYPKNVNGEATYQDSQFRTWGAGNLTADPTDASHLAAIWSDMRNSPRPANTDPYQAKTDSDIVVSQSRDGGKTWSTPKAIQRPGDQFMPWGAYDAGGRLRIGAFDRSYDPLNHEYGYTLWTETSPGSLSFGSRRLTTVLSQPTRDDNWFLYPPVNSSFPHPTTFMGDYSNIAAKPTGGVVAYWTDMRNTACWFGHCAWDQDAYFASSP